MSNIFNSVKGLHPKRNSFSAHTYRNDFTAPLGVNIPCYQQHLAPGSYVKLNASALVRLQALISPIMDNLDFYVHFWQIPYRLLENDRFTEFISGEIESSEYEGFFLTPYDFAKYVLEGAIDEESIDQDDWYSFYTAFFGNGGVMDFLGYDYNLYPQAKDVQFGDFDEITKGGNKVTVFNYRPLLAYLMLHLHWYMNENVPYFDEFENYCKLVLQDTSNPNSVAYDIGVIFGYIWDLNLTSFFGHGWDKDYFTSALPNLQYGDPVTISITGPATVTIPKQSFSIHQTVQQGIALDAGEGASFGVSGQGDAVGALVSQNSTRYAKLQVYDGVQQVNVDVNKIIGQNSPLEGIANIDDLSVITINELRFANALQVFKEREMRFGRRRLEYYKGFFGVTPEDLRLHVPRYLGGGRIPINITDIEQTSATQSGQPLGRLAGKGTALGGGFAGFTTFASEETILLGICFSIPHQTYANAVSKFLMKTNDRYDYFNPSFEHLGEQEINNIEVYSGHSNPNGVFGYTPRYTEYRFHMNEVHGQFKDSLAYWNLSRIFDGEPALNPQFVYMSPNNFNRIFAVDNQPNMLVSMIFRQRIVQPVSKYGTPMLLV